MTKTNAAKTIGKSETGAGLKRILQGVRLKKNRKFAKTDPKWQPSLQQRRSSKWKRI